MKRALFYVIALASLLSAGCGRAANRAGSITDHERYGKPLDGVERAYRDDSSGGVFDGVQAATSGASDESRDFENSNLADAERAKRIKNAVETTEGVDNATVVVNGHTAVIGLTLTGNPSDAASVTIKKNAHRAAMNADNGLSRAAITTTPEMFERVAGVRGKNNDRDNESGNEIFNAVPSF